MNKSIISVLSLALVFALAPQKVLAATYNLVTTDTFVRASTTVGNASSSTNVGNGWKDFTGNIYKISNNKLVTEGTHNIPANNALYYDTGSSSDRFQVGKARVTRTAAGNMGVVARFNPASGGSGYMVMEFSGFYYIYKSVNGVQTLLKQVRPSTAAPVSSTLELVVTDFDSSRTLLTLNTYNASSTLVGIVSYVDISSPIQTSGYWGITHYANLNNGITRAEIYSLDTTGPVEAPVIFKGFGDQTGVDRSPSYKNSIHLTLGSMVIGGTSPYTFQWQRSLSSGGGYSDIPGGTGFRLDDTGLQSDTLYYYRLNVTDSSIPAKTATSEEVSVRTLRPDADIIGFIGDSITFGVDANSNFGVNGTSTLNTYGARAEYFNLTNAGYNVGFVNKGVSGRSTNHWAAGTELLSSAISEFTSIDVNTVSITLGTVDGQFQSSTPDQYYTNMIGIIGALLAPGTGIEKVILNFAPYNASGGATPNALVVEYQEKIRQIASTTPGVYLGDTTLFAFTQANPTYINGLHPTQIGHTYMGNVWAKSYVAALKTPENINATERYATATITWTTDAPATSVLQYGTSTDYGITQSDGSLAVNHEFLLTGLNFCTTYNFRLSSVDGGGYGATSTNQTFTTLGCTGVGISGILPSVTENSATISWTTDEVSTSAIEYGLDAGYGLTASSSEMTNSHSIILSGLTPGTKYYYRILSVDSVGNVSATGEQSFSTVNRVRLTAGSSGGGASSVPASLSGNNENNILPPCCKATVPAFTFMKTLSTGMVHAEVKTLQQFLNSKGFIVSLNGAGSIGRETSFFGPATRAALARFQKANGISPAVGFFGPITRAFIANMK